MTALAGFWSYRADHDPLECCRRMLAAQAVYAPDEPAFLRQGSVALGRRLFQTLPEDRFDKGPVIGGGERWAMVADVRLDNRDDLQSALGLGRSQAQTLSDTALLMKAIERWEDQAFQRIVGDFAVILRDDIRDRLILARDFLGLRPLYYHRGGSFVAAASMAKGLHALPDVPHMLDDDKVAEFLAVMPESGDRSFFQGISRVAPGEIVIITRGGEARHNFWNYEPQPLRLRTHGDYVEAVREAFDRSVEARLRRIASPIATHLSGGLDSGAVASTAARLLGPDDSLTAFTAAPREGYDGPVPYGRFADESEHARAVAELYPNIEHVLVRGRGQSPLANLDRNYFLYERPVLNLCNAVWTEAIYAEAKRRRIGVLLTGNMGNMSISYGGLESLAQLLAEGRIGKFAREALALHRKGARPLNILARTFGSFLPPRLWVGINRLAGRSYAIEDHTVMQASRAAEVRAEAEARGHDFSYVPRRDPVGTRLWVLRRHDLGNSRKGALGGWGIDVRDPTADRRLIELCLSIPADQYLVNGVDRAIAHGAFSDRLPDKVLRERRSGYQGADWHEGLEEAEGDLTEEIERIALAPGADRMLDLHRMRQLARSLPRENHNSHFNQARYRIALLRGVSVGHFRRRAQGSNS